MIRTSWVLPLAAAAVLLGFAVPAAAQQRTASIHDHPPVLGVPDHPATAFQASAKNRSKGALWGGAIGLVAGGVLGALSVESNDDGLVESTATGTAVVLGAAVGAGIGALLGATVFAPARSASPISVVPVVGPQRAGVVVFLRR